MTFRQWAFLAALVLIMAMAAGSCTCGDDDDDDDSDTAEDDDDETDDDTADDDSGDDDTEDDDDTADDDDDSGDDDDTTPCTPESYIQDGGACEGVKDALGATALYFEPTEYPAYLDEVSFYIEEIDTPGTAVVEIYTDPDCTDPNDAALTYTTSSADITAQGWVTIALGDDGFVDPLSSGCWFVRPNQVTGAIQLGMDGDSTGEFYNGSPGAWKASTKPYAAMIRGVGCVGGDN